MPPCDSATLPPASPPALAERAVSDRRAHREAPGPASCLRYRRWFAALSFLLLLSPLVAGIVRPESPEHVLKEGRRLRRRLGADVTGGLARASRPGRRLSQGSLRPAIRDDPLHKDLTKPLFLKGNTAVLIGRDGRMFYEGNEMVRQSAGLVLRTERVAEAAECSSRCATRWRSVASAFS